MQTKHITRATTVQNQCKTSAMKTMILVVGHLKGGCSKSSLAVNLTVASARHGKRKVLLVDGDQQATAMGFTALRAQNGITDYTAVALAGSAIRTQLPLLAQSYRRVIVDVGGQDTSNFRAALTVADKLLVPVPPRTWEVWSTDQLLPIVEEAQEINPKLQAYCVLSLADPSGTDNDQVAEILRGFEPTLTYLDAPIVRRKAWSDAVAQGLAVHEFKPRNSKAVSELTALYKAIFRKGEK